MAKLSDEEQAQLDALLARRDAPDEPAGGGGPHVAVHVDLSDKRAVGRAIKLGLLSSDDPELTGGDSTGGDGDDDDDQDDDDDADDAPQGRRRSLADRWSS